MSSQATRSEGLRCPIRHREVMYSNNETTATISINAVADVWIGDIPHHLVTAIDECHPYKWPEPSRRFERVRGENEQRTVVATYKPRQKASSYG